jgi:hypothetical protein
MDYFQTAYGLSLKANQFIPGLKPLASRSSADIRVLLRSWPSFVESESDRPQHWYTSPFLDIGGQPTVKVWKLADDGYFKLSYSDGAEFILNHKGSRIWARWPDQLTLEDITVYLLGPILGFALRLRGMTCLHASVVCIEDKAIALIGRAGSGKSTTAAGFAKLGYPILADDVAALKDNGSSFSVQPGYPHLRLWPSSVQFLYGHSEALPRLVPQSSWDKCYLNLNENGQRFQQEELPLACVYFLDERVNDAASPSIHNLSAAAALMGLVTNSYANYLLDRDLRRREFLLLTRLSRSIPTKRLVPHSDPARLLDLCTLVLDDLLIGSG